jgi:hypothetical protein
MRRNEAHSLERLSCAETAIYESVRKLFWWYSQILALVEKYCQKK